MKDVPSDERSNISPRNATLLTVVIVTAILYFARMVLIPFALSILLAFLLAPLVVRLRHWKVGRVVSVLSVVTLAFAAIGVVAALMTVQLSDLAHRLPEYHDNLRAKVESVRKSSSGTMERLSRAIHSFSEQITPRVPEEERPGEQKPVPVEIRGNTFSPLDVVRNILGSVINIFFTAGIVVVFVIFILFQREDLRDRFIRLMGSGQIHLTTKALDDAARRVSRYLLAQLALNVGFGVLAGIGLFFLGLPNPVLWGVLAVLLRYVPYLGIWLAAAMPAAVALATGPGWLEPVWIFVLYFGIDLLVLNFIEPLVYGGSTGISPMAILVAAIFWTWLWGPIGLLLSTPLTVCLVVVGRYVPSLEFLSILLGDQPVLTPDKRFYQRLLAMDVEEATDVAQEFLKEKKSLETLYDEVIIPALVLAEEDRHRGKLDEKRQQFIAENARLLVEDIAERSDELTGETAPAGSALVPRIQLPATDGSCVLSMPARDEMDEVSAIMLAQLLNRKGILTKAVPASLASERLDVAARERVAIACIAAVPPFGFLHARYLTRRLRQQFPEVKIVVALLNHGDAAELKQREPQIPADELVTSLQQAVAAVAGLASCEREQPEQTAFSS